MLDYDIENSPGYWVIATAHVLTRTFNEELQKHGITRRQWELLGWLSFVGELSQTELAERMGIEAPTLVGVLDRMERDGWIERVTSASDRRKKLIRPTERVEPVWAHMVECGLRVRGRATDGLSGEQLGQLREILAVIRRNLTSDPAVEKPATASQA